MSQDKIESRHTFMKKFGKLVVISLVACAFIGLFANGAHAAKTADQLYQQVLDCNGALDCQSLETATQCLQPVVSVKQSALDEYRFGFEKTIGQPGAALSEFATDSSNQYYVQFFNRQARIDQLRFLLDQCNSSIETCQLMIESAKRDNNPVDLLLWTRKLFEWQQRRNDILRELRLLQGNN